MVYNKGIRNAIIMFNFMDKYNYFTNFSLVKLIFSKAVLFFTKPAKNEVLDFVRHVFINKFADAIRQNRYYPGTKTHRPRKSD